VYWQSHYRLHWAKPEKGVVKMTAKQKEMLKNRLRVFHSELTCLKYATLATSKALDEVKPDTNLTKEIGSLIGLMPQFEYFRPQADWFKATIRKVCSGEINPKEASKMMSASLQEIMELMECFNQEELYSNVEHLPMEPVSED